VNHSDSLYTKAMERKLLVEGILERLAREEISERTARKQIAIFIGRGIYACQSHHIGEAEELFDVQQVCLVLGRAEGFVVAIRRSGEFKGETVLIPFFDGGMGFFGVVSRSDYRGPRFIRPRMRKRRIQQLRAAA
jgi:hypothetical protein